MADKTVLVVEDEFGTAEVLQLMLEIEGYRVVLAANGRDALARLASHVPDLVLTDFMMPIMGGAQLGLTLRANPATAGVPIVMMSGAQEAEVRRQFDGYDAFLHKPYRLEELLSTLRCVLEARAARPAGPASSFSALGESLMRMLVPPKPADGVG